MTGIWCRGACRANAAQPSIDLANAWDAAVDFVRKGHLVLEFMVEKLLRKRIALAGLIEAPVVFALAACSQTNLPPATRGSDAQVAALATQSAFQATQIAALATSQAQQATEIAKWEGITSYLATQVGALAREVPRAHVTEVFIPTPYLNARSTLQLAEAFLPAVLEGERARVEAFTGSDPWCSRPDFKADLERLINEYRSVEVRGLEIATVEITGALAYPPEAEAVRLSFEAFDEVSKQWRPAGFVLVTVPYQGSEVRVVCDLLREGD